MFVRYPATVDHFQVLSTTASGGMGTVYLARDAALGRNVALKFLAHCLCADHAVVRRFHAEAKAMAELNHPNVVDVYYMGQFSGRPYFAMEYIDGGTLATAAERGPLSPELGLDYLIQAARGLAAAAAAGKVHRDVKPANLLVTTDGTVKVSDFGLVKALHDDASTSSKGVIVGTPQYMAPEQAREGPIDVRTDIYSLGVTFYYLLSGSLPYDDNDPTAVMLAHLQTPLPPLRERCPHLPAALCGVVARMLEKNPDNRFQGYDELLSCLLAIQEDIGKSSRGVGPVDEGSPYRARHEPNDGQGVYAKTTAVRSASLQLSMKSPADTRGTQVSPSRWRHVALLALAGALVVALLFLGARF